MKRAPVEQWKWKGLWDYKGTCWRQNKDYLGQATCWASNPLFIIYSNVKLHTTKESAKKINCKKTNWRYPLRESTRFACQPALRSRQISPFFVHFRTFFVDFRGEITEKGLKLSTKVQNGWKKVLQLTFRCCKPLKADLNK